ncbi:NADP-dependent oxidoreductase [Ideonella azotifigens]|uniref:NADP-dependent oxidoreductase n=1 Tax=Ideonella azotifigens TaxID=513160 RepID=A0ABN1KKK6_9BURK|nr:NADP-dependent oxidoreductase [Ideonella azotifigens]MCD2339213.1 NADP-dependent oxidoreductase [Ideonella azotifigens]
MTTQQSINQTTNQAMRIHAYGGPEVMQQDEVPTPVPGPGQVLVAVKAAGINGLDWKVRAGYVQDVFKLALPATLGIELAGVVVAVGPGASRFQPGDRVMGPLGGLGAYARFVAVDEAKLALTPAALSDVQAAALPVVLLTAWQALRAAGELRAGQRVLIHGAAGGVGGMAVQLAKAAGATVLATASAGSRAHVLALGADEVFDRHAQRFEDTARGVDLVLDLVGGETLDRSWQVLAAVGAIVSTAAPDVTARAPAGQRGLWFMMTPDTARLAELAGAVAAGRLRSTVAEVVGFAEIPAAIARNQAGHAPGKMVADFNR